MAQLHNSLLSPSSQYDQTPPLHRKKRNQPGMPDPEAEVVALSPNTLLATNRFVCEICGKGFQRDQNLQLHRRGHNLPWKLKQRGPIKKRVYVCPEKGCVHHDPLRALGDLTGIKKHFCRKHGEKKWNCEKCCKKYAVQSDLKAHLKICGMREYKCDCGTIFSRRDSFVTHRAFCDALAKESAKVHTPSDGSSGKAKESTTSSVVGSSVLSFNQNSEVQDNTMQVTRSLNSASCSTSSTSNHKDKDDANDNGYGNLAFQSSVFAPISGFSLSSMLLNPESFPGKLTTMPNSGQLSTYPTEPLQDHESFSTTIQQAPLSATVLLQKAAQMGAASSISSRFCGFDPIQSQDQHVGNNGVKIEEDNDDNMAFGRRFGLPSSQNLAGSGSVMVGPKPMTLDLLGLGTPSNDSFPAHGYLTNIGNPIDVAMGAFDEGKVSLNGQAAPSISKDAMLDP